MSTDTFRRYLDLLNEAETVNPLQDLIKPRSDGGNYIDPKTGIIMYVPRKSPKAGLDSPDPDPKPLTLGLLKQPEAQEIKKALAAAGLEIISVEKPSLFGSYPVAAVDLEKLAKALAGTDRQNAEISAAPTTSSIVKDAPLPPVAAAAEKTKDGGAEKSADSAASSVAVAGGEEGNSKLGGDSHCVRCGTPKMMHKGLEHDFVQGDDRRPDPVPQTGETGNSERSDRIKKMQEELKKAGADLGTFGPDGNGIDGVIGKFTRAAMAKYPDIAKKYPDLGTGGAENKETKVSLDKVNTALTTIEQILNKYKTKLKEHTEPLTPSGQMRAWRTLLEYSEVDEARRKRPTRNEIEAYLRNLPPDPGQAPAAAAPAAPAAAPPPPNETPEQRRIRLQRAAAAQADRTATSVPKPEPSIYDRFNTPSGQPTGPAQAMPGTQAAAGAAAGEAGTLSKLWKGAKGLAAKAALPLTAIYSIWEGYKQISALDTSMPEDQYRAAVAKIVARLVNEFGLFWVGAILGAAIAGAVTGPGALIGFVAGGAGGIAASYLLGDSVNAITDQIVDSLYGTGGSPSMTAEDRAAITQNLAIIEDFVKNNPSEITPELRARIDTVTKAAKAALAQPSSQKPAPAAPAPAPAAPASAEPAPAGSGATNGIPAATPDINTTLDKLDQFLKKKQFENDRKELLKNQHLLSETERMALHRDLFKEDWTDWATGAAIGAGAGAAAGAAAGRSAARGSSAIPTPPPSGLQSALSKSWEALKFLGRGVRKVGWWGALFTAGIAANTFWEWIKSDPRSATAAGISPQDLQEWEQLDAQLNKLIPDKETFEALPYDVQKKAIEVAARSTEFKKMVVEKAKKNAAQPPQ